LSKVLIGSIRGPKGDPGTPSATASWVRVSDYGADSTGANDSTTAFQSAVNAAKLLGARIVYAAPGNYKINSTITCNAAGIYFLADGLGSTVLNYHGSGDCIRMYTPNTYASGFGGGILGGLIIDGTSASAGACGAHIGDIYQLRVDFGVRNFQGTNSKGVWFDNQYYWCEDMAGRVWVQKNTNNVLFDNSANLSGQATGSFARTNLVITLDAKGVGNGLILQNGAQIYGSNLSLLGNMDYSTTGTKYWAMQFKAPPGLAFTATNGSPCTFTATGHYYSNGTNVFLAGTAPTGFTLGQSYYVVNSNITAGTFQLASTLGGTAINSTSTGTGTVYQFQSSTLRRSILNVNVECNATTGTQPGTISFSSASSSTGYNTLSGCTGIIDFSGNNTFAAANNQYGNFYFDGPIYGDNTLWRNNTTGANYYSNGALTSGSSIYANGVTRSVVTTTANITGMILQSGGSDSDVVYVENSGTGTITFAVLATSHVRNGTSCVIQPNTVMMFLWDTNQSSWYACSS
jgi:hypothetical protein